MPDRMLPNDAEIDARIGLGRAYTLVLLKRGPHRDQDDATAQRIQREHLRHLMALQDEGKLLINGPVGGDGDLRGISIYAATDPAEVRALVEADPAIVSGRLTYELLPWFGRRGDALR